MIPTTIILNNLKIISFISILITLTYLIPKFISPELITHIQLNYKVILLSKKFCQIRPDQCNYLINEKLSDPELLKKRYFETYELLYIVNSHILKIDEVLIKFLLNKYNPFFHLLKLITYIRGIEIDHENAKDIVHILIAISNTMIFHSLMGMFVSKMYMFFVMGIIITVVDPWNKLTGPIWNVLKSSNIF
ncbi:hypothetical protein KGF54_002575 [Candida jiufengensis]|uniref:uncharacterized protein n=1 Tax=Candida jiufengensis TaxID=497108 RepID=UPI002224290B|nr:uncharacterized protein KGF54_002575 [Candida jiufengensis]KAI5953204.1 hypothetical protein KGF54_002575 [Candida jiufengensis]